MTRRVAGGRRGSPVVFSDGRIEVRRDPYRSTCRLLLLGGMESSYVDLADPEVLEFSYLRRVRDVIDLSYAVRDPLTVLHVGGAACSLARHLAATRRESTHEVYEIDPAVVDVARRHLGLQTSPRLRVRTTDARAAMARRPDASADVVVGDAFDDGLVPAQLSTVEFVREVRRVLRPAGCYALNVIDGPPQRLARRAAATVLEVFGHVTLIASRRVRNGKAVGNHLLVGTSRPLDVDRLAARAARDGEPTEVEVDEAVRFFAAGAAPYTDAELGVAPGP